LGDAGRIYVSPDVIPIYRRLLPLATVITPNWFEVELLTEIELKDLPSLRLALRTLHSEYNVPNIVMSSIPLRNWLADALPPQIRPSTADDADLNTEYLLCISSSSEASPDESQPKVHARCVPLLPGYFSGVGDLFSALLLAHYQPAEPHDPAMGKEETPLSHAASFALAKTHSMLCLTDEYARALPEEERMPTDDEKDSVDPLRKTKRMRGRELRLVQGQDILRGIGVANERLRPWKEFWIEHAL
jgi:pyridoxine kinase